MTNKTIITIALASLALPSVCLADEESIIVVVPNQGSGLPDSLGPHAPARPIAQGYFDMETSVLFLIFNRNMENCIVEVSSTAGDYITDILTAACSSNSYPLSGNPGIYEIRITLPDGTQTGSQFILF